MSEELMSEETLRATVRQLVEGITYASYYRSGKAQVTFERAGREAFVRLLAMVSLEDDEDTVTLKTPTKDELRAAFHWIADLPEDDDYPDTLWGRFWEKYRELFPEDVVALQSPEEWAKSKGIVIVDPDGWRGDGAPALDTAITEAEFDRRAAESTIANRKEDGSW